MKKLFYVVLVVVVALFGLTFSYKNHQPVEINYYFGLHFQGQLPLLLFITFVFGLLAGYLLALLHSFGARRKFSKTRKAPVLPRDALSSPIPSVSSVPSVPRSAQNATG